jgi:hypothetical protein
MAWGYQLMVRLRSGLHLTGDERQTWTLREPVGTVELLITDATPSQDTELTFRAADFASEGEAKSAGSCLRNWLRLASAVERGGLDTGRDRILSRLGEAGLAQLPPDTVIAPDVHGLVVYEHQPNERQLRFAMRAHGRVDRKSDSLLNTLTRVSSAGTLSDQQALVTDLVSLAQRETSGRSRLLALVTAMEVLAERPPRTGATRKLVERFIEEASAARAVAGENEQATLDSLVGGLEDLRGTSISASIRQLAGDARPSDAANAAWLAKHSYKCRSDLVHTGRSDTDPSALTDEAERLVLDMLRASLSWGVSTARPE